MDNKELGFYSDHPQQLASMQSADRAAKRSRSNNSSSTWEQEQRWADDAREERRAFKRAELEYELRNEER